jgi:hypothetical protein
MSEGLHPVVDLMLARMKSNPEEFADRYGGRWSDILVQITNCGSDAEIEAIREGTRSIILDKAHAQAMDELLNGEERRSGHARIPNYSTLPAFTTGINTAGQEAMRITANGNLNIGGETLDAGMLKKIKQIIGANK